YQSALARLIERFPQTTEANEARWLLGLARQREDDASAASALWEQIPEGHPRWFEAQMTRAEVRIDAIESSLVEGDQRTAEQQRLEAREALDQLDAKVTSEEARADLVLARARLETLPNLGDPKRAIDGLERLLTQPLRPDRRGLAERLRVLALLELGRSVEAVRVTRALLESSNPRDLLQLARRLDQAAVSAPSDLLVRRFGEVLRMVSTHLVEHPRGLSESLQAEARLRGLRGLVFHGDSGAAREGLKSWPQALEVLPPEVQPDLARLALDAGDPQRALQVNRAILSRQPAGSRPWLQARLGEAEALVELRELDSARRLLDATATLHPDLGGERLHRRYQALLERLEQEQAFRSSPHH
ncbi:MAG TPA: hypothetical protein VFT74_13475, partial [Isosphaeraceae bacterium]|nr:hypothetical protein [Isosphaeraceae bacterium]